MEVTENVFICDAEEFLKVMKELEEYYDSECIKMKRKISDNMEYNK